MKNRNRIISRILALTLSMSLFAGCGSNQTSGEVKEQEKKNVMKEIAATEYDLVAGGQSRYYILIPENATENEQFAASELQLFLKEATGAELIICAENEADVTGSFLSVGATKVSEEAGVTPTYDEVKSNGFVLKTVEDDCYIKGFSDIGTRNAVYEWLSYSVDYECYGKDAIVYTETSDLRLLDFKETIVPSFEWRAATGGEMIYDEETTYRMQMNKYEEIYVLGRLVHNSMEVIDPTVYDYTSDEYKNWYSEAMYTNGQQGGIELPAQLCYSNEDMTAQYIENVVKLLDEGDANVMLIGMEDNDEWCTCEKCTESKETYGTNSAVMIKFANKVQEAVNAWCEENRPNETPIKCIFFAYYETVKPPVTYNKETGEYEPIDESVVLHEDLGIMYAPITASYIEPFTSDTNADTAEQIKAWSALTDNLHAWTYALNAQRFFATKKTFEVMQSNYKYLLENGTTAIYDQSESQQSNGNTGWCRAKWYVMTKLQWNVNLNMDELLDDFFANYYGAAGDTLRTIFEEERQWMATIYSQYDFSGRISDDLVNAEYWSYSYLKNALSQFEKAYEDIEVYRESDLECYKVLNDRITMETLQSRFLMINLYGTNFTADELLNMKYEFKNDAERLGIEQYKENVLITELWEEWNI